MECKAIGYETVSATPDAPGLSDSALGMATRVQVKRIGSSAQAWQAAMLAIGAARFRRKPAPGLQSAASTPTARRASHRAKRSGTGFS